MKLKTTFLAILLASAVHTITFAQNVECSEISESNGFKTFIHPTQGKKFYSTVWKWRQADGDERQPSELKYYENFKLVSEGKISLKTEAGNALFNNIVVVDGQVVIFLSDKTDGQHKLYCQSYGESCVPGGAPLLLSEYTMPKGKNNSGEFKVIQSANRAFFCVQYVIPGRDTEKGGFGYKVYDAKFKVISEGKYESPYGPEEAQVTNYYLSNTGDLFLGMKVYNTNEKGKVRDKTSLKKYLVFLCIDGDMKEMNLEMGDRGVSNVTFSADEKGILTCTALYGPGETSTKGVLYFQIDIASKEIVNEGSNEFSKEFITEDWSEADKKEEEKGNRTPALYSCTFREVHTTADNGIIVVMEEYRMSLSSNPATGSNTRQYYYNDIILLRIEESGQFEWIKRIDKHQTSSDDNGYYSGIGSYFTSDKLILFFDDNNENYTESGDFSLGEKGLAQNYYSPKKNCMAKVEIDLKSGEYIRNRYTPIEEIDVWAVPQQFMPDYTNNELFMYFQYERGKKEKFCLLKF